MFRDRDRHGLLVFFVCIILFSVAAAVYFLTHLLVAAAPVVVLARRITISCVTAYATRRGVGQGGGAGGASCEDHFLACAGELVGVARGRSFFRKLLVSYMPLAARSNPKNEYLNAVVERLSQ